MANLSLKNLLWIDAIAAMLSGFFVLILSATLSKLFNFPDKLLITLSMVSLGYASFSLSLAQQKSNPKRLLILLVIGNSIYAILCVILLTFLHSKATFLGLVYLLLESAFVAALALLEWRQIKLSIKNGKLKGDLKKQ
ncbi:MAG: hypothetical protein H7Z13_07005 [Ferruginibacter sp.]|nr:hypothetical protein [Ferruginibacter sp.]